jgi:hypothetical protein
MTAGQVTPLGQPQRFSVKPVRNAADGVDYAEVARYQQQTREFLLELVDAGEELSRTRDLLRHMQAAAVDAPGASPELFTRLDAFGLALGKLEIRLSGDKVRARMNESLSPSISARAYNAANTWHTTRLPTATQKTDLEIARTDFADFRKSLDALLDNELKRLETDLRAAGAPSWR